MLQLQGDTVQERFLEAVESLNLQFPVSQIAEKVGVSESVVSLYLNDKRAVSDSFLSSFCKAYNFDYDALTKKDGKSLKKRNVFISFAHKDLPELTRAHEDQPPLYSIRSNTEKQLADITSKLSKVTSSLEYNISRTLMNEALLRTGLYYQAQVSSRDEKHYKAIIQAINQSAVAIFDDIFEKSGLIPNDTQKVSDDVKT